MAKRQSVNDVIHDDLISQDILLRKVTGDCQNRADKRLDRLSGDLKVLITKIDPFSTNRADARKRRLAKLEEGASTLTREAYADIERENRKDLQRIARIESEATVNAITSALP